MGLLVILRVEGGGGWGLFGVVEFLRILGDLGTFWGFGLLRVLRIWGLLGVSWGFGGFWGLLWAFEVCLGFRDF